MCLPISCADVRKERTRTPLGRQLLLAASRDHLLHDLPACRLQWAHAAARQEQHPFVLIAGIHNIDPVARDGVMERGTGVFGDELKKSVPPRITGHGEYF